MTKKKTTIPRPRALGVDIFAGGFTVGVRRHFDVLAHFEESDYGVATVRHNMPELPVFVGVENWPIDDPKYSELDFIYGNPPCAAWSQNNAGSHRGGWRDDERLDCTRRHFRLLERLRPLIWAWESVPRAPTLGEEFVRDLVERAHKLGYSATSLYHNAKWCGAPQDRPRWFLVLHRIVFNPPAPNWAEPTSAVAALAAVKPRGEPAYDAGNNQMFVPHLKDIKPGERLRSFWEKLVPEAERTIKENGHTKGRPGFGHVRLDTTGPASATVGYSMVHPTEDRFLSINEVAALAGFPDDYEFIAKGSRGAEELDLIARGVCPPVGEWLAREVATWLQHNEPVTAPDFKVLDYREPPNAPKKERGPRKIKPVPITLPKGTPISPPAEGRGRLLYLRELIKLNRWTTEQLVDIVNHYYPKQRIREADVATQRGDLRLDGIALPEPLAAPLEALNFDTPEQEA